MTFTKQLFNLVLGLLLIVAMFHPAYVSVQGKHGGFAELFSVPLANVPTNIVSMDSHRPKAMGFFNMSAVSSPGGWLDPDNLPVLEK